MGAADYCLGREPLFFWNTMMFVENFHWYSRCPWMWCGRERPTRDNHVGCSDGMRTAHFDDVRLFTTPRAEQAFSYFKHVR